MFGEKNQKDKEDSLEYVLNPDALTEEDLNIFLRQLQSTTPFENSYNELSDLQVIDADSFLATEPSGESVDAENVKSDSNRKRKSENLSSSEPAKKISKSCEYRRQFIYKDLIERGDLRLHEKLVPVNLIPPVTKRKKNTPLKVNNREIITIGQMYEFQSRDKRKYFFYNGEPVPQEKVPSQVKILKNVDGRKVITDEAFYRRNYITLNNRQLTREEIKQIYFNPTDQKCYLADEEVVWASKYRTQKPLPSSQTSVLSHMTEHQQSKSEHISVEDVLNENPGNSEHQFNKPGLQLLVNGFRLSPVLQQKIEYHFEEIYKLCQQQSFHKIAYQGKRTPTMFPSLGQLLNEGQTKDKTQEMEEEITLLV